MKNYEKAMKSYEQQRKSNEKVMKSTGKGRNTNEKAMRSNEKQGDITGATWVFAGSLITIILVPKPFCILALFFLSLGDTFAAIVGMNYPFLKIGRKTLSGSIACFATCCIIGLLFSFGLNASTIILGALIATLTELSSMKINDNLSIPIFSGLSMYFFNIP